MTKFLYKIIRDSDTDADGLSLTSWLDASYSIMKCIPTSNAVHYILVKKPKKDLRTERENYNPEEK